MLRINPVSVPIQHNFSFKGNSVPDLSGSTKTPCGINVPPGQYEHGNVYPSKDGRFLNAIALRDFELTGADGSVQTGTRRIATSSTNDEKGMEKINEWFKKHGVEPMEMCGGAPKECKSETALEENVDAACMEKSCVGVVENPECENPECEKQECDKQEEATLATTQEKSGKPAVAKRIIESKYGGTIIIEFESGAKVLVKKSDGSVTVTGADGIVESQNIHHFNEKQVKQLEALYNRSLEYQNMYARA